MDDPQNYQNNDGIILEETFEYYKYYNRIYFEYKDNNVSITDLNGIDEIDSDEEDDK